MDEILKTLKIVCMNLRGSETMLHPVWMWFKKLDTLLIYVSLVEFIEDNGSYIFKTVSCGSI